MAKTKEPTVEAEALAVIVGRRGREAVIAELRADVAAAEADAGKWAESFGDGRKPFDAAILAVAGAAEKDRDARRRLAILDSGDDGLTLGERLIPAILETGRGGAEFKASLTRAIGEVRTELAEVAGRIDAAADVESLMGLIAECRRLKLVLAGLERDVTLLSEAQGRAVREAIDQAGGGDQIARQVRDVELIRGEYFEGNSHFDALVSAETKANELATQLRRFGGESEDPAAFEPGTLAFMTANRLAGMRHEAERLRARIDREEREEIASLIAEACKGDESSRAFLGGLAREVPEGFAPGFADDLEAAIVPETEADALVQALRDRAARHDEAHRIGIQKALARKARRNADEAARARQSAHQASLGPTPAPSLFSAEASRLIAAMLGGDE